MKNPEWSIQVVQSPLIFLSGKGHEYGKNTRFFSFSLFYHRTTFVYFQVCGIPVTDSSKCGCLHNGTMLKYGQSFQKDCNMCECLQSGTVQCGTNPCRCNVNGQPYEVGQSWRDGCKTCKCWEFLFPFFPSGQKDKFTLVFDLFVCLFVCLFVYLFFCLFVLIIGFDKCATTIYS